LTECGTEGALSDVEGFRQATRAQFAAQTLLTVRVSRVVGNHAGYVRYLESCLFVYAGERILKINQHLAKLY